MFIYKYMSGYVEHEQEEIDVGPVFDPHNHRKIEHPTTYGQTLMHMIKGSLGAGILAMPQAVSRAGVILGTFGILLIGSFATFCILLLVRAQYELCKRLRKGYMSYPKSMKIAIVNGPKFLRCTSSFWPVFVSSVLVTWQLGLCCVYAVFVAENIKQIFDNYGFIINIRLLILYLIGPFIVVSMQKNLKLMTPMSFMSNMITFIGLMLVFYYLIQDDVRPKSDLIGVRAGDVPIFVGTTLFAMEAVGVVLALEYNMEKPKQFGGICGLFSISMGLIITLYITIGAFGYLKYQGEIKASVTLNLPPHEKKAQLAKLLIAVAVFFSFPLQNYVAYAIVWRKVTKKFKPTMSARKKKLVDYLLRLLLILGPCLVAAAMPHLGPFISLFGAFCLSLLAIIMPGLMDVCIWYPEDYGYLHYKMYRDIGIIVVGLFCLVAGVITSVKEIVESFE